MRSGPNVSLSWHAARFVAGYELKGARRVHGTPTLPWYGDPISQRAFCPVERKTWVHRGTKQMRLQPVLAGYTFVEMTRGCAYRWQEVSAAPGFLGFIGGEYPDPVICPWFESILEAADDDWVVDLAPARVEASMLRRGDRVRLATPTKLLGGEKSQSCEGVVEYLRDGHTAYITCRELMNGARIPVSVSLLEKIEIRGRKQEPITLANLPRRKVDAPLLPI